MYKPRRKLGLQINLKTVIHPYLYTKLVLLILKSILSLYTAPKIKKLKLKYLNTV